MTPTPLRQSEPSSLPGSGDRESRSRFGWLVALLLLCTAGVHVGYAWHLGKAPPGWADEMVFDQIGWNLACTGHYESTAYRATPVEPAMLAAVYRVCGHDYRAARVCQAAGGGGLLALAVVGIGTMLFNRTTGLVAGVITALYPPLLYLSGVFYAEFLFAVLLAMAICCLVRWHQAPRVAWLAGAGLLFGLAILCRPIALSLIPVMAIYAAQRAGRGRRLRTAALFLAMIALVVAPWTARNELVFHHFVLVSSGKGFQLWRGNNDVSQGNSDDRLLGFSGAGGDLWQQRVEALEPGERAAVLDRGRQLEAELSKLDEVDGDQRLGLEGRRWAIAHPGRFVLLSGRRLLTLYSAFSKTGTQNETSNSRTRLVAAISFYPILLLGMAGAVLAWQRNRASWILHGTLVMGTLVYLPMIACTRFRLPLDVFWILLASVAMVETLGWLKRLRADAPVMGR